jgi:hypothetical protein
MNTEEAWEIKGMTAYVINGHNSQGLLLVGCNIRVPQKPGSQYKKSTVGEISARK